MHSRKKRIAAAKKSWERSGFRERWVIARWGGVDDRITKRTVINESGCWEYTTANGIKLRPMITIKRKTIRLARYIWQKYNGPIPPKMDVCHTCDNPSCIRLQHLFIGTRSDNIKDAHKKGRMYNPKMKNNTKNGDK